MKLVPYVLHKFDITIDGENGGSGSIFESGTLSKIGNWF
jgi:hypothetical protein